MAVGNPGSFHGDMSRQGGESGLSYNPRAGPAPTPGRRWGFSGTSAPLRLPPPASSSSSQPRCCLPREAVANHLLPGEGGRAEPPPQTFVSGRRLLPAPSTPGPGGRKEGGKEGGMEDGAESQPQPLKTQSPDQGLSPRHSRRRRPCPSGAPRGPPGPASLPVSLRGLPRPQPRRPLAPLSRAPMGRGGFPEPSPGCPAEPRRPP